MANSATGKSSARERIITTAERLFYADGIRAVGIDRIIAEAGVAKMTLYNHFSSKDDLILAVLQYREAQVDHMFAAGIERQLAKGRDRFEAFFAVLKEWFRSPGFRGCSFINARVELADPEHPASQFSARHKERFHRMLKEIVSETAGATAAKALTPAIALLVEGAIITAVMKQSARPAETAAASARRLIQEFAA